MNDIELHSRVALVNGADDVYAFALAGTEGWVRDFKKDDHGYELVKIEWDKDHWRYNKQPDGWTFKSHFKVIGPPNPPAETDEPEAEASEEITLQESPPSEVEMEAYIETMAEAMDAASESEAFMMIAIRRMPNPDDPEETIFVPQVYVATTNLESGLLLDLQLAECAAQSYEEMVYALIEKLKGSDGS